MQPSKHKSDCSNLVKESTTLFRNNLSYCEKVEKKGDTLYLSIRSNKWKADGIDYRIVSYDTKTKKAKSDLLTANDFKDQRAKHITDYAIGKDALYYATYAVDGIGDIYGKAAYNYSVLSKKSVQGIQTKIFDKQVIQDIKLDTEYLYLGVSDRHKKPFIHKIIRVSKNDFDQQTIVYESPKIIESFDVSSTDIFILMLKGKLLLKDKTSFKTHKTVDVNSDDHMPYYMKVEQDRVYIGYARSLANYSWADIGYIDLKALDRPVVLMNLNFKNVFDSFVFDDALFVAFKAGCLIKIDIPR